MTLAGPLSHPWQIEIVDENVISLERLQHHHFEYLKMMQAENQKHENRKITVQPPSFYRTKDQQIVLQSVGLAEFSSENEGVELRKSYDKGEGVFAAKLFCFGETVMTGVIAKTAEANHSHASQIGENEYVLHAGLISKVNHSCEPNCGIRLNKTGAHDFIAIKDIQPHEEITFDYAMRNYTIDHFPYTCRCGSRKCRGRITGWKDLSESRKKEYAGFVAPYLLELD
jgi:hypothetical protein